MKENGIKIEDYLFGSVENPDSIENLIHSYQLSLIGRIEGLPEAEININEDMKRNLIDKHTLQPAVLFPDRMTYKKVRITTSENRTLSAIRIEIPFEGNKSTFNWRVPTIYQKQMEPSNEPEQISGSIKLYWSMNDTENVIMIYTPMTNDMENDTCINTMAKATAERVEQICGILKCMNELSAKWNESIIPLALEHAQKRQQNVDQREKMLQNFKITLEQTLLLKK